MADGAGSQLIGIAGPSGAGKTLLADTLQQRLGLDNAAIIPLDAYYQPHDELPFSERSRLNFDAPDVFDWGLLNSHIVLLASGCAIRRPVYDYTVHTRSPATVDVDPLRFVIIEGVLALHHP
ncbi:MAG: uridine kinase, partial [candidate division Zixibacteria bacterium]|nr:uridine kinase [candidate division Zixibacteria bacterium]